MAYQSLESKESCLATPQKGRLCQLGLKCSVTTSIAVAMSLLTISGCGKTERDWKQAREQNTTASYSTFLVQHPHGAHAGDAKAALESIDWMYATRKGDVQAILDFYRKHPDTLKISSGRGIVAGEMDIVSSATSMFGGTAHSELIITLNGVNVSMSKDDACALKVFECKVDADGWPLMKQNPARSARVVMERDSGRILSLDFSSNAPATTSDSIHAAAASGDLGALKSDARLFSSRDVAGHTPLIDASSAGREAVVAFLIANHVNVNDRDDVGNTALYYAKLNNHADVAETLRQQGGVDFVTEFCNAVESGNLTKVKSLLLDDPRLISRNDASSESPIHVAVSKGHREVVEFLLANGADPNDTKGRWHQTPLFAAGDKSIIEVLLQHGADVNARDDDGETPLGTVANAESAELLLAHGADARAKDNDGTTPLHHARDKAIAALLLAHGAEVNAMSSFWGTPLHLVLFNAELAETNVSRPIRPDGLTKEQLQANVEKLRELADFLRERGGRDKGRYGN